jgi:peptidoglycan/xylan/chitin deacetylase (PgdA/CDA1 family)
MPSNWSAFTARVSNRLARRFCAVSHRLPANNPMVSFTFDDIPESAASVGAPMLEEYGGRGTFYISGGLVGQWSGHWAGIGPGGILDLHRSGHEIACHTYSHKPSNKLDAASMSAEIETNRRYFYALDPSIKLENFAYPYGVGSMFRKAQLNDAFRSSRAILPGVNHGTIDLQFLRATPLVGRHIDREGIERAFDEAATTGGWLIFYSHDVAETPSPYGCTPQMLRDALEAASRRKMPIVSVADALRRAGVAGA